MRVYAIQGNGSINQKKRPAFGLTKLVYKQTSGVKEVRNATMLFRPDLDWFKFAEKLGNRFRGKSKVNVYSAASSDGSEAYSLAIALMEVLGEKESAKFFPIMASDKNKTIIDIAKRRFLNLYHQEIFKIPSIGQYFEKAAQKIIIPGEDVAVDIYTESYLIKPKLAEKVKFEQLDMERRVRDLTDDSNTVLMCRNVFPYLGNKLEVASMIRLISEKLKTGSIFVVGGYDIAVLEYFRRFLAAAEFVQLGGLRHIYRKNV